MSKKKIYSKEYNIKIIKFYIKGLINDLSKIFIYFLIFYIFNLTFEYFVSLCFLILFRLSSGGIHMKNYLSCFIFSLIILSSNILLGKYFFISQNYITYIVFILSIIDYKLSPIQASTRPTPNDTIVSQAKFQVYIGILLFILILYSNPHNIYINIGLWTFIIHNIQLISAYFMERRQKK